MPIPEHQLQNWSSLGAQKRSQDTYTSIKSALRVDSESIGMECDVYLQGSYPNYTNIIADGDVDVVVETRNTRGTKVEWKRIRTLTKFALINYYGQGKVNDSRSGKCIKVTGSGNYLNADVVPCLRHNPRRFNVTWISSRRNQVLEQYWYSDCQLPKTPLEKWTRKK